MHEVYEEVHTPMGGSAPIGLGTGGGAVGAKQALGPVILSRGTTLASGIPSFRWIYPHRQPPGAGEVGAAGAGIA